MYSLRKSKTLFFQFLRLYRKKRRRLAPEVGFEIKTTLCALQKALLANDRARAETAAIQAQQLAKHHLKKTIFEYIRDSAFALGFALIVAVLIRSLWFEFFKIPTGSMRPTFQEKDHLVVSKTAFGINIPLLADHFYFDPALVKRNGIVIFTGANMDIRDVNTRYFYLFPGKKQYVKRLIGKPGDTLYFYGGRIYGIDRAGQDISPLLAPAILDQIDHVPYIRLGGTPSSLAPSQAGEISPSVILKQMNQPVAKLKLANGNRPQGKLLPPYAEKITDYYQLWGFGNYGMSRLLTKEQVLSLTDTPPSQLEAAPLYLEIFHHPSIAHPAIIMSPDRRLRLSVSTNSTILPLQDNHLQTLFSHLYTARFIAKNDTLYRYGGAKPGSPCFYCPKIAGIPNGTYEFYYGKAYKIFWGGRRVPIVFRKELPSDHPLLQYTPAHLQLFYNLGIEFNQFFAPSAKDQQLLPSRYVYYREGTLYAMGAPLIDKDDPTLNRFIQNERLKEQNAPMRRPYRPFIDAGPPLTKEGTLDLEKIRRYGITVPDHHYLVLGDNYAMSSDSREFGFVPEDNIRGVPLYIFWPLGPRIGQPPQIDYPTFTLPRSIIWSLALIALVFWRLIYRWRHRLSIPID
ncbi:MAG: signal peptidase I [Chlamydiota bacterium]